MKTKTNTDTSSSPGAKIKFLNTERKPLTKEKYKELSGFHNLSDEQAEQAVHTIQNLAKILYMFASHKKAI
jgi:hypothetical protein